MHSLVCDTTYCTGLLFLGQFYCHIMYTLYSTSKISYLLSQVILHVLFPQCQSIRYRKCLRTTVHWLRTVTMVISLCLTLHNMHPILYHRFLYTEVKRIYLDAYFGWDRLHPSVPTCNVAGSTLRNLLQYQHTPTTHTQTHAPCHFQCHWDKWKLMP